MATVTIKLDKNAIGRAVLKRLEAVNDSKTMLAIHNTLAKRCDPYVPFLEGPLSQTIEVSSEGVRYTQPYAHYQYYGENFNHTLDYHPLASSKWDEAMMRDHREEFNQEIKDIILRRLDEANG